MWVRVRGEMCLRMGEGEGGEKSEKGGGCCGRGGGGGNGYGTLPALYCVTLCWVCFLHSLPLQ